MGAPKGNKFPQKFKTPPERQKAFKAYLDHISAGNSQDTFHHPCVFNTIMKMISDYPDEFDDEVLAMAKAKGKYFWESMGKLGAAGKIKNFNQGAWWRNMQNKLGWKDKIDHSGAVSVCPVSQILNEISEQEATLPICKEAIEKKKKR